MCKWKMGEKQFLPNQTDFSGVKHQGSWSREESSQLDLSLKKKGIPDKFFSHHSFPSAPERIHYYSPPSTLLSAWWFIPLRSERTVPVPYTSASSLDQHDTCKALTSLKTGHPDSMHTSGGAFQFSFLTQPSPVSYTEHPLGAGPHLLCFVVPLSFTRREPRSCPWRPPRWMKHSTVSGDAGDIWSNKKKNQTPPPKKKKPPKKPHSPQNNKKPQPSHPTLVIQTETLM